MLHCCSTGLTMIIEGLVAMIVLAVAISLYTITMHYTNDRRLPPGPIPLPFLGNVFDIGPQPHLSLTSLAKKYGDIFRLTVGIHRIVVVNSIEAAREALVRRSNDFAGRPLLYTASLITRKGKSISFGDFNIHDEISKSPNKPKGANYQRNFCTLKHPVVRPVLKQFLL